MNLFDIINIPFGYVIRFCNRIVGNHYVWALLLFAIIIEIVLLPFGIKQQKNSIKQAKLRPKEMAIRKKYAGRDDNPTKQKMSLEIQALYQKEGYNPMGGCLPLLIQFPVIIALYNIVMDPFKYILRVDVDVIDRIANVVSSMNGKTYDLTRNISLLSDMQAYDYSHFAHIDGFTLEMYDNLPNLSIFGIINLGDQPQLKLTWLLLIPILTFLAYFFSMKMTRKLTYQPVTDDKAMGCSNNMMDIMMPLMSVYISFIVPAAIGVYWIFKCLLGVVKQVALKYAMPIPKFTEEDYRAAEKEFNVKAEKQGKGASSGRVVRSLHHIDDEDFEDTAEQGRLRREALEAQQAEEDELRAAIAQKKSRGNSLVKADDRAEKNKEKQNKKNKAEAQEASQASTDDNTTDGENTK